MQTPQAEGQAAAKTKIGGSLGAFLLALVIFGVVLFLLPPKVRPWMVLVIVLGALVANPGAIDEWRRRTHIGG